MSFRTHQGLIKRLIKLSRVSISKARKLAIRDASRVLTTENSTSRPSKTLLGGIMTERQGVAGYLGVIDSIALPNLA